MKGDDQSQNSLPLFTSSMKDNRGHQITVHLLILYSDYVMYVSFIRLTNMSKVSIT